MSTSAKVLYFLVGRPTSSGWPLASIKPVSGDDYKNFINVVCAPAGKVNTFNRSELDECPRLNVEMKFL